jgi:hypothetical protein
MTDHENNGKQSTEAAGTHHGRENGESCRHPGWHHRHGSDCNGPGWWPERSLAQKITMGIGFGILGVGFIFLCGWVVMLLWNWLMPEIFGLKHVTYWQAWGLVILSHLLFKNFGSGHGGVGGDRKRRRHLRRYLREEHAAMKEAPAGE